MVHGIVILPDFFFWKGGEGEASRAKTTSMDLSSSNVSLMQSFTKYWTYQQGVDINSQHIIFEEKKEKHQDCRRSLQGPSCLSIYF